MQLQSKSSRGLCEALQIVSKCIASRNTLAILDNVLLTQRADGKFLFTASSSDSQLTIPAPLALVEGKFKTPVAIPVDGIVSYLATLPNCAVNINISEDSNTLTLGYCIGTDDKVKSAKVSLPILNGEDFPLMRDFQEDGATNIVLPEDMFATSLKQAQFFAADDELRPVLSTLCIDIAEDMSECYLVASDGHALIKVSHSNNPATGGSEFFLGGTPQKILIHKSFFKALSAFAACEQINIAYDGGLIRFVAEDLEFVCKAIEGRFPNYNSVIPKENLYNVVVDKKEMLSAIKRVSIFGNDSSKLIKFSKDGMFLNVSAQDIDFATSADDQVYIVDSDCMDGFAIGFNSAKIIGAISAIEDDVVRLSFSTPERACIVTADVPSPRVLTLSMPMILS